MLLQSLLPAFHSFLICLAKHIKVILYGIETNVNLYRRYEKWETHRYSGNSLSLHIFRDITNSEPHDIIFYEYYRGSRYQIVKTKAHLFSSLFLLFLSLLYFSGMIKTVNSKHLNTAYCLLENRHGLHLLSNICYGCAIWEKLKSFTN